MQDRISLIKNYKLPNGEIADIKIADGKIEDIVSNAQAERFIDAKRNMVIPAMIDPHVHARSLKQSYKEDWKTVSKAALAGGNSFIFDMPNTIPSTTTVENFLLKLEYAKKSEINFMLNIGATNNNTYDLKQILKKHWENIGAIKVFLASSSSNEVLNHSKLAEIFRIAKDYNKVVIVHTELQDCLNSWSDKIKDKAIENHHLIRNRECSIKGTEFAVNIAEQVGNKVYIAHLSTKEEIEIIKGKPNVYAEVTPHHLFLNIEDVKKIGIKAKVNPPIRTKEDNLALQKAVKEGIIDVIATDHAPHSIEEKLQNYQNSPSGFGGLETKLPLLITAVKNGIFTLNEIIKATSYNPAKIFNLKNRGEIKKGYFADICIVNADESYVINPKKFYSKSKYSPFEGRIVYGKVIWTIVNGIIKYRG